MKCEEARETIWSGEHPPDLEKHVQECEHCREEADEMRRMIGKLDGMKMPAPSRSLQPSREIIRQTVRNNRRKRWMNIGTIAASLVLLLGAGTYTGLQLMQPENAQMTPLPQQTEELDPALASEVVIATDVHPEFTAAIKERLRKTMPRDVYPKITITDYVPEPGPQSSFVTGEVKLEIEYVSHDQLPKPSTEQIGQVRFIQQNGKWVANFIEQEIAAKTPEEAVRIWAEAIKTQDAFREFGVFHPNLKELTRAEYKKRNWVIGTPATRVESYTIEGPPEMALVEVIPNYTVTFQLSDGKGTKRIQKVKVRTERNFVHHYIFEKSYVEDPGDPLTQHSVTLPDRSVLNSRSNPASSWLGMEVTLQTLRITKGDAVDGGAIYGSDALVNAFYPANIPNLEGAVMAEFIGTPPDSIEGKKRTPEYYLQVNRADPEDSSMVYVYMIKIKSNSDPALAKQTLTQIGQSWQFPQK